MDRSRRLGTWSRGAWFAVPVGVTLLAYGCPGTPPPVGDAELIFPVDYRETFAMVRDCRNSIEHAATIRVWVNDIGLEGYLGDAATLPEGTIVVKEEFEVLEDCDNDDNLTFRQVMRKESAGFDLTLNDWRFQEVESPTNRIVEDGPSTCRRCHTEPECVARDLMCTEP